MTAGISQQVEQDLRSLRLLAYRYLERVFPDFILPGARILHVSQAPAICATSYACCLMVVQLSTGAEVKLFLKDFSSSPLGKDGLHRRAEREVCAYRDLLAGSGLGTARYYGTVSDETEGRLALILEFVEGERLRSCALENWIAAARWLGQMQAYFARHAARWQKCEVLLRHDANFFWARAEGAMHAVSQAVPGLAGRLAEVVDSYGRLVDVMTSQPRTLVHGSYRPQNILVAAAAQRICPVDWEWAAIGAPFYDLAFVSDGFRPPARDQLWDAYLEAAGDVCRFTRDREEMRYVIECFRLHKILKSLSEAQEKSFPEATIIKQVDQAERLSSVLRSLTLPARRGTSEEEERLE
jgi:Ser/Thr protein kinase RdoA (MazF antagonist)